MIRLNLVQIVGVSRAIASTFSSVVISLEDFTDPRYYPPRGDSVESVMRYLFFMVAIDHRTSRYRPFEDYVLGEMFHGADLLYRLGKLKYDEDPEFFSPTRMSRITAGEVSKWLSTPSGVTIWDPEVRAELLRDTATKLLKYFDGSVSRLISKCEGYIRHPRGAGLGSLIKIFKAYSDPVEKKMFLFVKFLSRRGLASFKDRHNIEVPVDNHLTRIALRLKIVEPSKDLEVKILSRVPVSETEDVEIRRTVRYAYKLVSKLSGIEPDILDDFLWTFGRKFCKREQPACEYERRCPLGSSCPSYGRASYIVEHNFQDTFYY
jgi:hypothetical protein